MILPPGSKNIHIRFHLNFSCSCEDLFAGSKCDSPSVKILMLMLVWWLCCRLRCLVKQLERGEASVADLKKNLEYAASVLENLYFEETRRLVDPEDELRDIQSDSVPSEVRDWLASTFTRQRSLILRRNEDKPRFRSIVHAVQAGIFVERMYRRTSNMTGFSYPPNVITVLKHVDMWSFDVFALNDASGDHALKFVFYELLTRYDLINRFKVCQQTADFHCLDQSLQICVPVILYIYYSISKVLITFMLMNGSINKSKKKRC
uniref:PDE1 N-terminal domain-containing protein n=1 Tax=Lates calcarifer TaxID=8187 RepID=A0A4W6FY92_LATCA